MTKKARILSVVAGGIATLALAGGFAAASDTSTLTLPVNQTAITAAGITTPTTGQWATLGLSNAQGLASQLNLSYSSLTNGLSGTFTAGKAQVPLTVNDVQSFSANTTAGTVVNLNVSGSLSLGGQTIPVLLAAEFIPGTQNMQGTLTINGLGNPIHLPLGQAFITPAMAQTINQAAVQH